MDGGAWEAAVHGVAKSRAGLSDFTLGWEDPLEKGMAIHSSMLAWKVTRTKEPGGLQSIGFHSQTRLSD